jgi:uncharacterized secreted protein with C-terminal beta-propeller domain
MSKQSTGATILLCCGLTAACSGSDTEEPDSPQPLVSTPRFQLALEQAQSCAEVADYVAESIADEFINVGILDCPGCRIVQPQESFTDQGAVTAADSFDSYTGTNTQEEGVDEPDFVETDANGNFYLIDGHYVVVANGLPPNQLGQIGRLEIDADLNVEGLLLDPDNQRLVVVLSERYFYGPVATMFAPVPWNPVTELLFVDVSDPANPVVDRRMKIQGYRLSARRIGDRVHLVTHWTPIIPVFVAHDAELLELRDRLSTAIATGGARRDEIESEIRDRVDSLVATIEVHELLPEVSTAAAASSFAPAISQQCANVAAPRVPVALALTSITSVDTDGSAINSLHIVNDSWQVYASENSIFLSQASGGWWFSDRQRQQSAIYKFEIGAGAPRYAATGVVDGWIGPSFQLSEHDGFLRVVTTRSEIDPTTNVWDRDNNLFVLQDDTAGTLEVVGAVKGFAADESVYSTRFLGDRAFVVTFRQIDPLFAFDLTDPFDPRLAGEVTMPGVSTYIHPLDDTHLLTIGYDGDDNRLNGNFQLQVFDVQHLDDPRLVQKYVPEFNEDGIAWTTANYDYLAFNFFPGSGTLTVPAQYYGSSLDRNFTGFIAFSVDPIAGIEELGRLDHNDLARQIHCIDSTGAVEPYCQDGRYIEAANPRRSVTATYNGATYIYTLSNVGMKVSAASDFSTAVGVLPLPYRDDYAWLLAQ